jgi:biotin-dependent carboxylase-like uncharacterized protein
VITVSAVAGLVTVQDIGRCGHRHEGVSPGGPLDAGSHAIANAMVGNAADAASLEGCLASCTLTFGAPTVFVLTGAAVEATLDAHAIATYEVQEAAPGSTLHIGRITRGAVWYLGLRGGIDCAPVLGSRSTLVHAGLGPAPLRRGSKLALGAHAEQAVHAGPVPAALRTALDDAPLEWLPGTRLDALDHNGWAAFFTAQWSVSPTSDRTGYRLDGPALPVRQSADLASEPSVAGAVQLPPSGRPIVLMAEHPTVGGYPVIGVVPADALARLAQRPPRAAVRFVPTTYDETLAAQRQWTDGFHAWRRG